MKNKLQPLNALLAPKAVYGGWYLRQRPREAIKIGLAYALGIAVVIYLALLFIRITSLIVNALPALAFGAPFEFPATPHE